MWNSSSKCFLRLLGLFWSLLWLFALIVVAMPADCNNTDANDGCDCNCCNIHVFTTFPCHSMSALAHVAETVSSPPDNFDSGTYKGHSFP